MPGPKPSIPAGDPVRHPASELQEALLATADIEEFLQQLTDVAVATIGGGISAGITVAREGHPITVASSDAYAAQFDEVQYGHDDGPCLTAMRAGKIVLIDDLATDERFRPYQPRALALGVRSSISLPLEGGEHAVGALNLYSRRPYAFGAIEQSKAQGFANEASRALTLAVRLAHSLEITDQLRAALTSRTVIDQTIGIIMGQNRCDANAAFAVLRSASQNRNVKLRDVAAEIITTVSKQPPQLGHVFEG
ncbi:GAF and ANTAR domain-containing protein [Pengzhenrongella phosphoraccumulans]|uniref:GAF and ANTAR domain-containing protein n=1 Tax=Pengzhenrongella phosphoraccumulans TaxID=3114394 RepID=UPI00388E9D1B